ncbi:MAG: HDOD domain-containing protein [Candidatus Acidiferrales bacterium]|jgi:EAL and modified HD-GYP domain-containing signal transduction protein
MTSPVQSQPDDDDGARVANAPCRFVARQPILTADKTIFGYELLFRDGIENFFQGSDSEAASRSVLDSSLIMGFDLLCDGTRAFINCTRDVLLKDYVTLLPPPQTVVEILEDVPTDEPVVAACQRLKEAGYVIALDDFTADDPRHVLTHLADIIKVDLRLCTPEQSAGMVERYGKRSRMLAEKVETPEEFATANALGYSYFQGYFFRKPEVVAASEIPTNRITYIRMLQAASRPDLDAREIESLIKSEPSLCYRLLRYLNSSLFGFSNAIHSVSHALATRGARETRRCVRLVAMLGAGQNRPSELVLTALVRGRFCELLALKIPHGDADLFLMGIMSLMDAILEMQMERIVESVPLDRECQAVLLGEPSSLSPVYELMLARESGQWSVASKMMTQLRLSESQVGEDYWQAMEWARNIAATDPYRGHAAKPPPGTWK